MALSAWTSEERDVGSLAMTGAFFFVVAFLSMRMSSRVTTWMQGRYGKAPPAPPEPMEATTDRPEHAQRRRSKRKKRGYRRKR
jgi:hypothetical protein